MPGPKIGPRPPDFDEQLIRQSPTFIKWATLNPGEKLRYACREFTKGQGEDEERLMRRIMIARRNNVKDHQMLKRARQLVSGEEDTDPKKSDGEMPELGPEPPSKAAKTANGEATRSSKTRRRRPSAMFDDEEVANQMDVAAVEATRTYRSWLALDDGAVCVYNQKYIKGREGHDWLLRKNIWRRMRYRRENKKIMEKLRQEDGPPPVDPAANSTSKSNGRGGDANASSVASQIIDQTLLHPSAPKSRSKAGNRTTGSRSSNAALATTSLDQTDEDMTQAVEAAVAVAESYTKSAHYKNAMVHNPLDTAASSAALDAAARLAASADVDEEAIAAATAALAQTS